MAAAPAGVGRLEEEALRRKERLKALREKTGRKVRNMERCGHGGQCFGQWEGGGLLGNHCSGSARARENGACAGEWRVRSRTTLKAAAEIGSFLKPGGGPRSCALGSFVLFCFVRQPRYFILGSCCKAGF